MLVVVGLPEELFKPLTALSGVRVLLGSVPAISHGTGALWASIGCVAVLLSIAPEDVETAGWPSGLASVAACAGMSWKTGGAS